MAVRAHTDSNICYWERTIVTIERHPYAKERQRAKEIVYTQYRQLPWMLAQATILENQGKAEDKELISQLRRHAGYLNNWNTYNIMIDAQLRKDVRDLVKLINIQPEKKFERVLMLNSMQ
jgi:hypothetical protein